MKTYLPYAERLLTSPYNRPVDKRICAYIDGFTITGEFLFVRYGVFTLLTCHVCR